MAVWLVKANENHHDYIAPMFGHGLRVCVLSLVRRNKRH